MLGQGFIRKGTQRTARGGKLCLPGTFHLDPVRTARDFHAALEGDFGGAFRQLTFAITDWSPERRFLGPFRDAFSLET